VNEWASVGLLLMTLFRDVVFNVRKHQSCMLPATSVVEGQRDTSPLASSDLNLATVSYLLTEPY